MRQGLTDWQWQGAAVRGTMLPDKTAVITTARVAAASSVDGDAFLITTADGHHYYLCNAYGGHTGVHHQHMAAFTRRPDQ